MSRFLSPTLSAVTPYTPGEQPQDQQYIKLNTNESPYLPSPAVVAAVSEVEVEKLRLYSDPACADLLRAAAAHFGLQPDQIMPGNGSDENLFFALRAFCDEQHPLAYADITYGCYGVWCGLLHIPSHIIPLKDDFTLDPKDYDGLHQTIVIANPNAPTGLALPRSAIEGILQANPDNVVIVDEAYVDFGGESCVPLIDRYENLLVVQTFSKSRQLAGARLGLAMGNAKLIADLNRVKFSLNPYNINRLTLKAGQAALADTAYFDRTRAAIVDTRSWTCLLYTSHHPPAGLLRQEQGGGFGGHRAVSYTHLPAHGASGGQCHQPAGLFCRGARLPRGRPWRKAAGSPAGVRSRGTGHHH